jgi:hypothetical protein
VIRRSTNTRNREKAELTARNLEDGANPHKPVRAPSIKDEQSNLETSLQGQVWMQ